MCKKLCILLIFSKLYVEKLLIYKYRKHNLYAIFAKILNICKQSSRHFRFLPKREKELKPYSRNCTICLCS